MPYDAPRPASSIAFGIRVRFHRSSASFWSLEPVADSLYFFRRKIWGSRNPKLRKKYFTFDYGLWVWRVCLRAVLISSTETKCFKGERKSILFNIFTPIFPFSISFKSECKCKFSEILVLIIYIRYTTCTSNAASLKENQPRIHLPGVKIRRVVKGTRKESNDIDERKSRSHTSRGNYRQDNLRHDNKSERRNVYGRSARAGMQRFICNDANRTGGR